MLTHPNSLLKDKDTIATYLNFYNKEYIDDLPSINAFRRLGAKKVFKEPILLIKEGFKNNEFCSSIVKSKVAFNSTVLGLHSMNIDNLRVLSAMLNSRLASYYLLMISSSWGIERERIKPNEVYTLPFQFNDFDFESLVELHKKIEEIITKNSLFENKIQIEKKIEEVILSAYGITPKEVYLIEDFFNTSLDIFYKKEKSKAFNRITLEENMSYAETLYQEINDFYSDADIFVNATIYNVQRFDPLNLIVLHFCNTKEAIF